MSLTGKDKRDATPRRDASGKKNPCGKCGEECAQSEGLACGACTYWWHVKCIDGATPEMVKRADMINKMFGTANFLCNSCSRFIGNLNRSIHDVVTEVKDVKKQAHEAELERQAMKATIEALKAMIEKMQTNTDQVREKVGDMEKEIESGMEQAMKEVKEEMSVEAKEQEKKASNIVVFGAKEADNADSEEAKADDAALIRQLAEEIEVEITGEVEVLFRAGKKPADGDKPRPLVVKIEDDETRERLKSKAYLLGKKTGWRGVFVAPDLTRKQREEGKKRETALRAEAEKKNEEAKNEGKEGGKM